MSVKTTTSIGELAVSRGYLTKDQLDEAMLMHTLAMRRKPHVTLGSVLLELGYLTPEQLREVERQQLDLLEEQVQQELPDEVKEALKTPANRYGKFVRLELIGRGGLGEVWKAYDLVLRRTVAIKFVQSIREDHWKLFLREAELLGKLQHPNIVPLYEIGDRFIVMPYIRGKTLDASEMSINGAAKVAKQAALAIQYAHDRGILHRDIKPTNIMIEPLDAGQMHVWVMDFGIAKEVHSKETLQTTGMIMGTPAYMAPELIRGRAQRSDVRSDVYSLGATLYQAVTGRMPFLDEDLYELMRSIVEDELEIPPRVPRDLRAIIQKAMEKSAEARYATAGELSADLERFLKGESVRARPAGVVRRIGRRLARSKALVAFVLIGLAGAVFGIYGLTRKGEQNTNDLAFNKKNMPQNEGGKGQKEPPASQGPAPQRGSGPQGQEGPQEQQSQEWQGGKQQIKSPQGKPEKPNPIPQQEDRHADSDRMVQSSRSAYNAMRLDDALNDAEIAVKLDPKNPAAYVQRARAYIRKNRYEDAKKDLEECLRLDPKYDQKIVGPLMEEIRKAQESQQKDAPPSPKVKGK